MGRQQAAAHRILSKLVVTGALRGSECIVPEPGHYVRGYKRVKYKGKGIYVHRFVWIEANGPIEDGLDVLHNCDNKACANLDHLYLGTDFDNQRDRLTRNRDSYMPGESNPMAKISQEDAKSIRTRYSNGERAKALAEEYGLNWTYVYKILRGDNWNE